ncbi:AmmeMemoRadiSam system protein A [Halioxenophilus sp. WMMB6]|uniref:AmmeMemoRadiSam system protein A n=1 Tax=Halioxenophilus sp. WMMB6 TaxID=3073815 RepID=UPI00295E2249|nr:AmmeMemoRadiSam system protein A [Halioxenophilus sp. WMMB6]
MIEPELQTRLRQLARDAINQELRNETPPPLAVNQWPAAARAPGASFVTLKRNGQLRGCIGNIEAHEPLVQSIRDNAISAAFRDPRFAPLAADELADLELELSVLTTPYPISVASCEELARQLRPNIDGLILSAHGRRGLFLPQVWESLPQANEFIAQLKRKAHLPDAIEPPELQCELFQVQHF